MKKEHQSNARSHKIHVGLSMLLLSILVIVSCVGKQKTQEEIIHLPNSSNNTIVELPIEQKTNPKGILFQSTDAGETWNDVSGGLPDQGHISNVYSHGKDVYISNYESRIYHNNSENLNQWTQEHVGDYLNHEYISGLYNGNNGPLVSISSHGFFKRIPCTNFWQNMGEKIKYELIYDIKETANGTYYVATASGIFKSQPDLTSWKKVYNKGWVKSMAFTNGILVASSIEGILRSADGEHWERVVSDANALYKINVFNHILVANREAIEWNMTHQDNSYLKRANNNSILASIDGGKTWQAMKTNTMSSKIVYDVIQSGNYLFASHTEGISKSADGGKTWTKIPFKYTPSEMKKINLVTSGNMILALVVNTGC
jgi:photosystem II stability/assembly factor-like uncharacterized protein